MNKRTVSLFTTVLLAAVAVSPIFGQVVGLKDVYANYFRFGSILNGTTANNADMRQITLREFNSITPENELKPDATILANGSTNDNIKVQLNNGAKAILKFCEENNIPVRGHTLVWHSQTPEWFFKEGFNATGAVVTPAVMDRRMESYIKNMFDLIKTSYPNLNLYAYDVVNEAASDGAQSGPRAAGSGDGQSMWVQVYGDNSFIEKAFTYARRYAPPTTKLFYNDYNEYIEAKRNYIVNSIVRPLKDKSLIDGMGMQSHLNVGTGNNAYPSPALYGQAITAYKNLGVQIHVTEIDATIENGNESYFPAQATYYKNIMNEILNKGGSAVTAVVVWGIRDDQSWRKDRKPLLFDASGNKKAAYDELVNLIPQSEWGNGSGNIEPPPPPPPIEPDSNGFFFYHPFEEGTTQGWVSRGAATVAHSIAEKANGAGSMYVSGRTANWNGAAYSLDSRAFISGEQYSFSATAMFASGSETDTFKLTLQYKDVSDSTRYGQVATAVVARGEWAQLSNSQFQIPAGATDLLLYVEMSSSSTDFYVDDAMGGIAGTLIGADGKPVKPGISSVFNGKIASGSLLPPPVTIKARTLTVNARPSSVVGIKIINLRGKNVASFKSNGGGSFSLRAIPAGIYIIETTAYGNRTALTVTLR